MAIDAAASADLLDTVDNSSAVWRSCWHAVALSREVATDPVPIMLLGEPWVLVRLHHGGEVSAFPDECPHRLAPLSAGTVVDGVLRCGYHGWCFDGAGHCVDIPAIGPRGSQHIPAKADLATPFGVKERYGLVWLAPEEPVCDIHEFPEWDAGDEAGFDRILSTVVRTPASAAQLVDNFLDASHFPYVHADTFGDDKAAEVHDQGIDREGWVVRTVFDSWYRNIDDPLVLTGEHEAVQPQVLLKQGNAGLSVYLRIETPVTGATFAILFSCLPESPTSTRIFKLMARDDYAGDAARIDQCILDEDRILREDLDILERFHTRGLHLDQRREIHTKADRLSLAWRRLVKELAEGAAPRAQP